MEIVGVIKKCHILDLPTVLFHVFSIYKKQVIQSFLKAFIEALSANFPILKKHDTTMIRVLHIPVPVFVF